jgi:hypothetical protein
MKKAFFTLSMITALNTSAQNIYAQAAQNASDSLNAAGDKRNLKDTVVIAVFEKSDTVAVNYLGGNNRNYIRHYSGYVVLKGFADQKGKYVQQPKVVAVLDSRKKPAKKVIQILQ